MTAQELFDLVVPLTLKQGKRSMRDDTCAYRGKGGLRCAIGHAIPDHVYAPIIEGAGVEYDSLWNGWNRDATYALLAALDECGIGPDLHELARDLQSVHDNAAPDNWREKFRDVATDYALSTAVLD